MAVSSALMIVVPRQRLKTVCTTDVFDVPVAPHKYAFAPARVRACVIVHSLTNYVVGTIISYTEPPWRRILGSNYLDPNSFV